MSPVGAEKPQFTHQAFSSARVELDAPQTAARETGGMHRYEDKEDDWGSVWDSKGDSETNVPPADEMDLEEVSSTPLPSSNGLPRPYHDMTKLLAEKAPGLLPNADLIKNLFMVAYAEGLEIPQESIGRSSQQPRTSQAQKQPPAMEETRRTPQPEQIAPARGDSAPHLPEARTTRPPPLELIVRGSGDFVRRLQRAGTTRLPTPASNAPVRGGFAPRLPEAGNTLSPRPELVAPVRGDATHRFPEAGNTCPPRPEPTASARGQLARRSPEAILPPAQVSETDSEYYPDSDYDSDMTDSDTPQDEIIVRPQAQQPDTDTMPDAGTTDSQQAAEPAMEQSSGGGSAASPPPVRQDLLDMLDDPTLPSEVYKSRFLEFYRTLKKDEEKLKHVKDRKEARDLELQILLLRTDIEKQRILLKAQVAYEEATDGEEWVVLTHTRPFATPGSDDCYGILPRPSTFMLKTLLELGGELDSLKAEMGGKNGKDDSEVTAEKTVRMENLQFFVNEFLAYYNADIEKEKEVRRQRDELERANPPKAEPPVCYPTPMIHDTPKEYPPPGTRAQPPRASTATPTPSTQQLDGSDALLRDNSGRRRPRLPGRSAYQPGLDMVEEDDLSESDVSMYTGE